MPGLLVILNKNDLLIDFLTLLIGDSAIHDRYIFQDEKCNADSANKSMPNCPESKTEISELTVTNVPNIIGSSSLRTIMPSQSMEDTLSTVISICGSTLFRVDMNLFKCVSHTSLIMF